MSHFRRCFFALTFSQQAQQALQQCRDTLAGGSSHGTFTHNANFHLTLEFIGEVSAEEIARLGELLEQTTVLPPAELRSAGLGEFHIKGGRLIWLGVQPNVSLMALQTELRELLAYSGFTPEDRPYRPHITLGRRVVLCQPLASFSPPETELAVHSVALMESIHLDGKLLYQTVCEHRVKTG